MADAALPDAWPLLLDRELACAYLRISADSFERICPVAPVDLGINLLRWRRPELDAWVAGLPGRLRRARAEAHAQPVQPPQPVPPADERRLSAVERAKARGGHERRRA